MKTKNLLALLLALVLCASLLTPVYALAEGENASAAEAKALLSALAAAAQEIMDRDAAVRLGKRDHALFAQGEQPLHVAHDIAQRRDQPALRIGAAQRCLRPPAGDAEGLLRGLLRGRYGAEPVARDRQQLRVHVPKQLCDFFVLFLCHGRPLVLV